MWNQIFSGVDLRPEDIERMREAVRTGTPILVPSHRSHLDYLLIGSQCYEHGLVLPYVVAGENLSFFPMGLLFEEVEHSLSNVHLKKIPFSQLSLNDTFDC